MPHSRRRSRSGLRCHKTSRRQRSGYKCSKRVCAEYFKSKPGCKRYRRRSRSGSRRRRSRRSRSGSRRRRSRRSRSGSRRRRSGLRGGRTSGRLNRSTQSFIFSDHDAVLRTLGAEERRVVRQLKKDNKAAYDAYLAAKKITKCPTGQMFTPFGNECRDKYYQGPEFFS